jgi:isocitrate dehydrogenase
MPTQVEGRRGGAVGAKIDFRDGHWIVPDHPIIPFIEGDGTGPDIWHAASKVFDAAVTRTSGGKRSIVWREVLAGEKSFNKNGSWLPEETLGVIREHRVAIKGPLTTPVGGGIRSLNVALRQILDLYACIRPVRYFTGVPAPVKDPRKLDVVIFRENIEDVYAGIEYKAESTEADAVIEFLTRRFGAKIRPGSAIGIKPMSKFGSQRLIVKAIQYAIKRKKPSVTLVHKGNIMKFTEGGFRDWGYEVAKERFKEQTVTEADGGKRKEDAGKLVIKDRIADAMFQQLVLRPDEYPDRAPNLNGDYLRCRRRSGGPGIRARGTGGMVAGPEVTPGPRPRGPGRSTESVILSGVMMFEELGWEEVGRAIVRGLEGAIASKHVTYDLARQMPGATEVSTSAFAEAIIEHLS